MPTESSDWIWNRKHKDVTLTIPNLVYYLEKNAKKFKFLVETLKGSTARIDRVQNDSKILEKNKKLHTSNCEVIYR